ncbi:unnamed protein product [Bemisia tabaci]|uniref:Magnesium-dependent phosphatase 1 n=1 Tax=Bemisia tabaci TaxID=7038 RepID=A0A9P0AKL8_BEMTA|nr:unnamed protein product [Bemisia tabaci]
MAEDLPLVVLDLDLTLWSFQVDKLSSPFLIDDETNMVVDNRGVSCKLYPGAMASLQYLKSNGFPLAIASRISNISAAYQLLHLFNISQYFDFKTIYPGSKVHHFNHLHAISRVDLRNMIFFDDDKRNIRSVARLGVHCVHVADGLTVDIIKENLNEFHRSRSEMKDGEKKELV